MWKSPGLMSVCCMLCKKKVIYLFYVVFCFCVLFNNKKFLNNWSECLGHPSSNPSIYILYILNWHLILNRRVVKMNAHLFPQKFAMWTSRVSLALGFINNKPSKDCLNFLFKNFRHASLYHESSWKVTLVLIKPSFYK